MLLINFAYINCIRDSSRVKNYNFISEKNLQKLKKQHIKTKEAKIMLNINNHCERFKLVSN